jgi:hypothetical protein
MLNGDVVIVDTSVADAAANTVLATSPFDWSHGEPVASVRSYKHQPAFLARYSWIIAVQVQWIVSYNQYRKPVYSVQALYDLVAALLILGVAPFNCWRRSGAHLGASKAKSQ